MYQAKLTSFQMQSTYYYELNVLAYVFKVFEKVYSSTQECYDDIFTKFLNKFVFLKYIFLTCWIKLKT